MKKKNIFLLLIALICTVLWGCDDKQNITESIPAAATQRAIDSDTQIELPEESAISNESREEDAGKPKADADRETSIAAQEESLKTTDCNLNGVDFKMILVEGGTFTMGSNARAEGNGAQIENQAGEHQVSLSSFLVGETEVTRALWDEVMIGSHNDDDLNDPVASVTVPACQSFVEKLNEKAHAANMIPADQNFHMLTEAQWEFAAKGGNKSKAYTYAGSDSLSEVAWTSSDGGSAHGVKLKKPNELGLYDMSGNVYEWVSDYAAPYSTEPQTDPCNTVPSNHYIKRGGSFYYNDEYRFTSTYRYFYSATDYTIGFRIGLS